MRNRSYIWGFLLIAGILGSCEKEEKYEYTGGNQIYFNAQADSSVYSFATQASSVYEDTAWIPVAISGIAAGADRTIGVEVLTTGTTAREGDNRASGAHFRLLPAVLKAHAIETSIPVVVFRQPDIDGGEVTVMLKIVTDENFQGGMGEEVLVHKLKINDILTKPGNWDTYLRRYFGEYGPVKYQFIIDKLQRYEFPETGENAVSKAELSHYRDKLRSYLAEEGPLYEEGGVLVTF